MTSETFKRKDNYEIISNEKVAVSDIYEMVIDCGLVDAKPGQFVNVYVDGVLLPRPISIADYEEERGILHLIYRVVGDGTKIMANLKQNDKITLMIGLGNGFDLDANSKKPLVIGGGLGVAPLYYLTKELRKRNKDPKVILGFNSFSDQFIIHRYEILLNRYGDDYKSLEVANYEKNGLLVTDYMTLPRFSKCDYFYTCGPKPMLKAVCNISKTDGEVSMEERIACGIGQCKCCSIETNEGMKTICHDGPVLKKSLVRWCDHE